MSNYNDNDNQSGYDYAAVVDDVDAEKQRTKSGGACLLRYCVCQPVSVSLNNVSRGR